MRSLRTFRPIIIFLGIAIVGLALMAPTQARAAVPCGKPDATGASVCHIDAALDPAALCNDGSVPSFWVRPGSGSGLTTWVFWLEGGGDCVDELSCLRRALSADTFSYLTSRGFKVSGAVGVLSSVRLVNPALYNANIVEVHYCSSDYWSGGYTSPVAFSKTDPATWNFQGRRIVLAAIASLGELDLGFANASTIVLGGSSAGGVGMTVTANDILPVLPPARDIRLVVDAGFTLDIGQFDKSAAPPYIYPDHPNAFDQNFTDALSLWQGRGDVNCNAGATTLQAQIDCYNTALLLQQGAIALPTFVAESQLDTAQLESELCPQRYGHCSTPSAPASAQGQYATAFGGLMATALIGSGTAAAYSVTSPDGYMHIILGDQTEFLTPYAVAGGIASARDVFNAWFANPLGGRIVSMGDAPGVAVVRPGVAGR